MNDEAYRKRLSSDLEAWIAKGWVSPSGRDAILETLQVKTERPAASILAWAGSILAGLAVIAFMAANWDGLPRFVRLVSVLAIFWAALFGAIWAERRAKQKVRQAFLLFSALVFAAGLGLVGQMYNLAGDPRDIFLAAGIAGLILGAAGRSGPAAAAGLLFAGGWYVSGLFDDAGFDAEDLIAALLLGSAASLAAIQRSRVVLHLTIIGLYVLSASLLGKAVQALSLDAKIWWRFAALMFAAIWAGVAFWGRRRLLKPKPGGATIYAYGAWFALTAYPFVGFDFDGPLDAERILHRLVWLALSLLTMATGNKDGQRGVLAAGVVSLVIAAGVILSDLNLNLLVATAVFALAAAAALGAAWQMTKKQKAAS